MDVHFCIMGRDCCLSCHIRQYYNWSRGVKKQKPQYSPALLVDAQGVQLCCQMPILTEVLNHVHEPDSSIGT